MATWIIGVKFDDNYYSKEYDFKNDIEGIQIGDKVVVDTQNGLQLATVKTVIKLAVGETYDKATKWIVQKIDMTAHNARIERALKEADLKKQMKARAKQLQDIAVYQVLAKEDSTMADLLKQLSELNG